MKLAVIRTGGKQYPVQENQQLRLEKLLGKEGESFVFDQVLLTIDGDAVKVGQPLVSGAKVSATIVKQGREPKMNVIKYKRKIRYRRKLGHRQEFTEVKIEKIQL